MKTKKSLLLVAVATIAIFAAAPRTSAVPVTFSGGSGTPLSFSLAAPVSYTIAVPSGSAPLFVFQSTGNLFFDSIISSSITFSTNGGSAQTLNRAASGPSGGAITSNDLYFFGSLFSFNVGDVVTLTAGTWTTNSNVAAAHPANGSYTTFITNTSGTLISTNGISGFATPESFSSLWLAMPLIGMFAARRFVTPRRHSAV